MSTWNGKRQIQYKDKCRTNKLLTDSLGTPKNFNPPENRIFLKNHIRSGPFACCPYSTRLVPVTALKNRHPPARHHMASWSPRSKAHGLHSSGTNLCFLVNSHCILLSTDDVLVWIMLYIDDLFGLEIFTAVTPALFITWEQKLSYKRLLNCAVDHFIFVWIIVFTQLRLIIFSCVVVTK